MIPNMTRDEFLFWKYIEIVSRDCEINAIGSQKDKRKKITGLMYTDISDENILSSILRLSYCITSKGFQVQIYTTYSDMSGEEHKKWHTKIPEFSTLCTKMFEWNSFVFDELIEWIQANSNWDQWAAKNDNIPTNESEFN